MKTNKSVPRGFDSFGQNRLKLKIFDYLTTFSLNMYREIIL